MYGDTITNTIKKGTLFCTKAALRIVRKKAIKNIYKNNVTVWNWEGFLFFYLLIKLDYYRICVTLTRIFKKIHVLQITVKEKDVILSKISIHKAKFY